MPIPTTFASLLLASAVANPAAQLAPLLHAQPAEEAPADAPPPSADEAPAADDVVDEAPSDAAEPGDEAAALPEPPPPAGAAAPPSGATSTDGIKMPKRGLGIGLLAGAGAAGLVAWGMVGWKVSILQDSCQASGDSSDEVIDSGLTCGIGRFATLLPTTLQVISDAASFTLAGMGGARGWAEPTPRSMWLRGAPIARVLGSSAPVRGWPQPD